MNAILKKDNVFVYVTGLTEEAKNAPSFILEAARAFSSEAVLFGGRVMIFGCRYSVARMAVDGIKIYNGEKKCDEDSINLTEVLPISTVVAYLNQMAALGVDTFIENYKKTLQDFKMELSAQEEKLESRLAVQENQEDRKRLNDIKAMLSLMLILLLNLSIQMFAGLDNYAYEEAYQYFINLFQ